VNATCASTRVEAAGTTSAPAPSDQATLSSSRRVRPATARS
jgi:hypothetical protein